MAGDWIKMRLDLQTHPKVVRILSATKSDKFRVIGGLHAVWSVFDTHSVDGRLDGYTPETLDHIIGWVGFSNAMISVGWLNADDSECLILPEFDEHNGKSGKRRAEDQKRKRNDRKDPKNDKEMSDENADKMRTKCGLEKRREDINKPPIPPKGGNEPKTKKSSIELKTYISECKQAGKKPIPDEDTVFDYANSAGLPVEFLELHWREFLDRYREPGSKRYKDWRSVFRKSVRGNWFRLWYFDNSGQCCLSSAGVQAKNLHKGGKGNG